MRNVSIIIISCLLSSVSVAKADALNDCLKGPR